MRGGRHGAGLTEGLKVASERLSWGFSRGAKALAGGRQPSDSLTAKARRALRAAPQVRNRVCPRLTLPPAHPTQSYLLGEASQSTERCAERTEDLVNSTPERAG
jgi:hypothetical protein